MRSGKPVPEELGPRVIAGVVDQLVPQCAQKLELWSTQVVHIYCLRQFRGGYPNQN